MWNKWNNSLFIYNRYLFIIVPVSLLAEDELVRSHLQTLDVPVQVTRDVNPIQVLPARTLSSMYQQLGKSTMLPLFLHCHTLWLAEKLAQIFLNQSGLNRKQIVTDSRSFTCAFWRIQVIFFESWLVHLDFCACCDWWSLISRAFYGHRCLHRKLIGLFEFLRLWLVTVIT